MIAFLEQRRKKTGRLNQPTIRAGVAVPILHIATCTYIYISLQEEEEEEEEEEEGGGGGGGRMRRGAVTY